MSIESRNVVSSTTPGAGVTLSRRGLLGGVGAGLALTALPGSLVAQAADGDVVLVSDGQPRCAVVIAADAPEGDLRTLNAAATLIVDTIRAATGVTLSVVRSEPTDLTPLYVGHRGARTTAACTVDGLIRDGFCAEYVPAAITLLGQGSSGTWIATLDFTERIVGAAHLLPGPGGTEVPSLAAVEAAPSLVRQQPDFADRRIYSLGTGTEYTHSNPNAVFGSRIKQFMESRYSHAMAHVYPPSVYGETIPEIYPVRDGVRIIPTSDTLNANWNPRWQDPITIQPAVDYVVAQLAEPDATGWVAMGMNDNGGYSDDTKVLGLIDSDGLFSLSNVFCDWLNKVAAGVEAALGHQDFHLGFLAYNDIRSAPTFDLHPSLVPHITRDLFGWTSEDLAEHDKRLIADWAARASRLGWWDYAWGNPIMIPRLYHQAQQRALQYLRDHDVTSVFVEMDQNFGDGSKAALYAKLLWDVDLDVMAARDEWCRRTAGDAGGPHLQAFDQLWNDFWTTIMPTTEYARGGKGMSYFWYFDCDYLNHVSNDLIDTSQAHLDAALAATTTEGESQRVTIVHRQHEYYRASVRSYDRTPTTPADFGEAVEQLQQLAGEVDERVAFANRRVELLEEFKSDPILRHGAGGPASGLGWNGWPLKSAWQLGGMMHEQGRRSGAAGLWQTAERLVRETTSDEVRGWLRLLLDIAEGRTENIAVNGDFSAGTIDPWIIDTASGWQGGEPSLSTEVVRNGPASLRIVGPTTGGGVRQRVPAKPGFLRSSYWFRATPTENPLGNVTNTWLIFDAAGKRIALMRGESKALETDIGSWREITMLRNLPEGTAEVECYMSYFRFAAQTELHVADISYTQTTDA
ncbi:DUF4838 domain-containing protein [Microlunatus sp. Y2014]|uniref:DUF4838 domain-containing protein n=1 Tax=Microlunatus sp. Y2014 TaxID=3418488 RepID=UPI003DA72487